MTLSEEIVRNSQRLKNGITLTNPDSPGPGDIDEDKGEDEAEDEDEDKNDDKGDGEI